MSSTPKELNPLQQFHFQITRKLFPGKIDCVHRFVSGFAKIIKPLQAMIKKYGVFKWNRVRKEAFKRIKKSITEAPTLICLDFGKEFNLYTFVSDTSYVAIITQNNDERHEVPISFVSLNVQGDELKYSKVEK